MPRFAVLALLSFPLCLLLCSTATAVTIEFDERQFAPLPYSEDGVTFTALIDQFSIARAGDGFLSIGSGGDSVLHARASSAQPFNLTSLVIDSQIGDWRFESSAGAKLEIGGLAPYPATVSFAGLPGWSNISYFDIVHDYSQPRRSISINRVAVEFVPEPTSLALLAFSASISLLSRRLRRPQG